MKLFILNFSEKYSGLKCSSFFGCDFVRLLILCSVSFELRLNLFLDLLQTDLLTNGFKCGEAESVAVNLTEQ